MSYDAIIRRLTSRSADKGAVNALTKIFVVGFHKTATSSLGAALATLGYRVCVGVGIRDPNIANNAIALVDSLTDQYDAFEDNPWPILYQHLDACNPGSRFILTLRSPESWLDSVVAHFGSEDTPMRTWIYGVGHPKGNEHVYLDRYQRHIDEVRMYFRDRPGDLLVMDITRGDGWSKLCTFLEREQPDGPFPHLNGRTGRHR